MVSVQRASTTKHKQQACRHPSPGHHRIAHRRCFVGNEVVAEALERAQVCADLLEVLDGTSLVLLQHLDTACQQPSALGIARCYGTCLRSVINSLQMGQKSVWGRAAWMKRLAKWASKSLGQTSQ